MQKLSVYAGFLLIASAAMAQNAGSGAVHVMSAWSPALPPVSENGAVYLTLKNYGDAPDRLMGASSPVAAQVEIHGHTMEGGLMTMRPVKSLPLNPGEYVKLEPGGRHLMLIGLKRPLKEGDQIALTLEFEKAPALEIMVTVEPLGATVPNMAGHEHSGTHQHDQAHGHGMEHGQKKE